jgi:hypothetical protein
MTSFLFLKSLFLASSQTTFNAGDRVNHVRSGSVVIPMGYVVAYQIRRVDEWPWQQQYNTNAELAHPAKGSVSSGPAGASGCFRRQ